MIRAHALINCSKTELSRRAIAGPSTRRDMCKTCGRIPISCLQQQTLVAHAFIYESGILGISISSEDKES